MKIVKHCHESLPHMVQGSLLGMPVGDGVLEITHSFPTPLESQQHQHNNKSSNDNTDGDDAAAAEGHDYALEMMRMLREVNVDNNCVGWYQSMYLGIFSTSTLLDNQLGYQLDLSANAVVFLYDPMQTSHGNLVIKCLRLTDECIQLRGNGENAYLDPKRIFEEIPVTLSNPGLARAFLADIADGAHADLRNARADTTFDRLDLSTNPYLEKHLEYVCGWVDDLAAEQNKFQYYTRQLARTDGKHKHNHHKRGKEEAGEGWTGPDAPRRLESLLISNQIRSYCDQMDKFAGGGLGKLYLAGGLQKEKIATSS
jgi:translation initiation factor 3 subunit H